MDGDQHQQQHICRGVGGMGSQYTSPVPSGQAGQTQFDHALAGKQGKVVSGQAELAPVKAGPFRAEHGTFRIALLPGPLTNRIDGFCALQGFIPPDQIHRVQFFL